MTLLIIGIIITGLGFYMAFRDWSYSYAYLEFWGVFISVISGVFSLFLGIGIAYSGTEYERFVLKRSSFEHTLTASRADGRDLESASMARDIAEWNELLTEYKYDNTTFYLGEMVDDRFDDLKVIR